MGVSWDNDHRPRRPVTARRQTLRDAERFAWKLAGYMLFGFFCGGALAWMMLGFSFS